MTQTNPIRAIIDRLIPSAKAGVKRLRRRAAATLKTLRHDPDARERVSAIAAFAFIFAFGAASLDYIITGGPDWNPGAAAAPIEHRTAATVVLRESSETFEPPPPRPEFDLAAYEAEGPIPDLLGGPEAFSPGAAMFTPAAYTPEPIAEAVPAAPAEAPARANPARKHKHAGR